MNEICITISSNSKIFAVTTFGSESRKGKLSQKFDRLYRIRRRGVKSRLNLKNVKGKQRNGRIRLKSRIVNE